MGFQEMISKDLIKINLQANTKEEAIKELGGLLYEKSKISDKDGFYKDVMAREQTMSTVFEDGMVMPHAKSSFVKEAAVAIGISSKGIDCNSKDGKKSNVFFLIAMPKKANDLHVKILSEIASRLLEKSFKDSILEADSADEVYDIFMNSDEEQITVEKSGRFFLGVTGCPVGVAHTYLAAKALKKYADLAGVDIKVETNGSIGVENELTPDEIEKAEVIIVACDRQIDMERFHGKQVIIAGVKEAIDRPEELIKQAMAGKAELYTGKGKAEKSKKDSPGDKKGLYKYLMNGVSYMIPFVVIGGLLIAISLAIGGEPTPAGLQIPEGSFWNKILDVGSVGFSLMIPILAGFIAYAIGDRPALAPGMIGGWIANDGSFYNAEAGTGFIGAIIAGLIVGYLVRWIKSWKFPEMLQPLVPIMIIPILASLAIASIFTFIIGAPIASLMEFLVQMLQSLSSGSLILIGIVIGLMQGFDMGGPFGKVAFMFSVGLIANGETQFMGAQACAIPVAPLGMAIATFVGSKMNLFNEEEKGNGKAALAMGLVGISEGAIPFAASDPLAVIPANMIGSVVACVLGFLFGVTNNVAHGGPIVALLGTMNKPVMGLLAMLIGSLVTAFVVIVLKRYFLMRRGKTA